MRIPIDTAEIQQLFQFSNHLNHRSDIRQLSCLADAAGHEVGLQMSNALPELRLAVEWDRNGSIGRNFFAVGMNITLPVANRNRGNIAAAKAKQAQTVLAQELALRTAEVEIQQLQALITSLQALSSSGTMEEQKQIIAQAEQQYLKRNMSMQEFVALFDIFSETMALLIENNVDLCIAVEELKMAKGL